MEQLQRRHLATFGLSEDACNPRARGSFAELVEQSLLVIELSQALLHPAWGGLPAMPPMPQ